MAYYKQTSPKCFNWHCCCEGCVHADLITSQWRRQCGLGALERAFSCIPEEGSGAALVIIRTELWWHAEADEREAIGRHVVDGSRTLRLWRVHKAIIPKQNVLMWSYRLYWSAYIEGRCLSACHNYRRLGCNETHVQYYKTGSSVFHLRECSSSSSGTIIVSGGGL